MALFDRSISTGQVFGYNGEQEEAYCREFAESLGGGFADGVNSGTSAVYIALRALQLEPFTEVIVPPISDPGGYMPVPLMNCIPIPADSAPGSFNIGPAEIERLITERTSAILVAHIAGIPAEMDAIIRVAEAHRIPVVEDCAQAHGTGYKGRLVGTFGAISAFSTMSGKHHGSAAQGGMVYTPDSDLYWSARRASDRGKPFGIDNVESCVSASLNFNSNDLAAAVGRVQLKKLPGFVAARRKIAAAIARGLDGVRSAQLDVGPAESEPSFWFLCFKLHLRAVPWTKPQYIAALNAEGIPARASYLHSMVHADWYKNRAVFGSSGFPWMCNLYKGDPDARFAIPNAEAADEAHFTLLFHERYGEEEVADIVSAIQKVDAAMTRSADD